MGREVFRAVRMYVYGGGCVQKRGQGNCSNLGQAPWWRNERRTSFASFALFVSKEVAVMVGGRGGPELVKVDSWRERKVG